MRRFPRRTNQMADLKSSDGKAKAEKGARRLIFKDGAFFFQVAFVGDGAAGDGVDLSGALPYPAGISNL